MSFANLKVRGAEMLVMDHGSLPFVDLVAGQAEDWDAQVESQEDEEGELTTHG